MLQIGSQKREMSKKRVQKRDFVKKRVQQEMSKRVQKESSKRNVKKEFSTIKHLTHVRIDSPTADNNLPSVTTPFKK